MTTTRYVSGRSRSVEVPVKTEILSRLNGHLQIVVLSDVGIIALPHIVGKRWRFWSNIPGSLGIPYDAGVRQIRDFFASLERYWPRYGSKLTGVAYKSDDNRYKDFRQ